MGDQQQLLTALHLVELPTVVDNVVEKAHAGIQELASSLPDLSDEERKRALLLHLHATRQQLQRLHVAVAWSNKAKAVAEVKRLLEVAATHGSALRDAADQLAFLWGELEDTKAPLYDVATAVQVLETGAYKLLPTSIEEQAGVPPPPASDAKQRAALRRMDFLLRCKLLASKLPEGMLVTRVLDGTAEVAVPGQYSAELTLVPAPRDDVTLAKYRPPPMESETDAGAAVDVEITQRPAGDASAGAGAPMEVDAGGPSEAAGVAASAEEAASSREGAGEQGGGTMREVDRWRWLLVSFKLLPEWRSDMPALAPNQAAWLQRHLEDKMWRAADAQQLHRLGAASSLLHFPHLHLQHAKQAPHQQPTTSTLSTPPAAAIADSVRVTAVPAELALHDITGEQAAANTAALGEGGDGSAPAPPDWALCPLALLHSVLRQAAGRLIVYSLVLTEARRLEKGSWEGLLRISRSAGTGLRFSYWLGQPYVTHGELLALLGGSAQQSTAGTAAAGGTAAPAVELNLEESGAVECTHSPPLHDPLSGLPVRLQLSACSLSIEELLLSAAAHNAATQLAAIQAVLEADGQWLALNISLQLVPPSTISATAPAAPTGATSPLSQSLHPGAGTACSPPSLMFRGAGDPSPFLCLSVSLKTMQYALAAGPAGADIGDDGGDTTHSRLAASANLPEASYARSALMGLIAATQQRVERAQKDALTLPLAAAPASVAAGVQKAGARGLLAVGLVASEVAGLCRQLVRRQRLAGLAAAAPQLGLLSSLPLPLGLLQAHLKQLPLSRPPLASDALTLALPTFPPPPDMVRWELQQRSRWQAALQATETVWRHRQRLKQVLPSVLGGQAEAGAARMAAITSSLPPPQQAAGGGGGEGTASSALPGECGAVRAHLLVEYEEKEGKAAAAAHLASSPATPPGSDEGGSSSSRGLRLSLVVSSCSARGISKKVLRVLPLPSDLLEHSSTAGTAAAPSVSMRAGFKRKHDDEGSAEERESLADGDNVPPEAEGHPHGGHPHSSAAAVAQPFNGGASGRQQQQQQQQTVGDGGGGGGGSSSCAPSDGMLSPLRAAVRWCREVSVWEQMVVQLHTLKVFFSEEWRLSLPGPLQEEALPPAGRRAAGSCQLGQAPSPRLGQGTCHRVICLPSPPALISLEAWAAQQRRVAGSRLASSEGSTQCSVAAVEAASGSGLLPGEEVRGEATGARGAPMQLQVFLEIDAARLDVGAWTATITSSYLAQLHRLYSPCNVSVTAPSTSSIRQLSSCRGGSADGTSMQLTAQGLQLRYEQCRGDSALTILGDVLRLLRLHICLARMTTLILAHPLRAHLACGSTPTSHHQQMQHTPIKQEQQQTAQQTQRMPNGNGLLVGQVKGGGSALVGTVASDPNWVFLDALDPHANGSGQLANGFYLDPMPGDVEANSPQQPQLLQQLQVPLLAAGAISAAPSNGIPDGLLSKQEAGTECGAAEVIPGAPTVKDPLGVAGKSMLLWTLPLCGSVALVEVGLTHAVLIVTPAVPPLQRPLSQLMLARIKAEPALGAAAAVASTSSAPQFCVTLEWLGLHCNSWGSSAHEQTETQLLPRRMPASGSAASTEGGGLVGCRLESDPPLPAPFLDALQAQLEAGSEAEFLDSLCLAAAQASIIAQQLSPAALCRAGLLPGAAALDPAAGCAGGRSALRLGVRGQQAQRALHLHFEFGRGGYTLVRLVAPRTAQFASWAEAAWAQVCELPGCHVLPDGAAGLLQAKQVWCGLSSLGAAVDTMLRALARGDDEGPEQPIM